jgi:glucan biosynthesis protein C
MYLVPLINILQVAGLQTFIIGTTMGLNSTSKSERFYYLDWLRVIAFSILLLEHAAEVFTTWNFAIKNEETSRFLNLIVMFFKPWRMPLLFLISGAAVFLSFKSRSFSTIIRERSIRLLLPLLAAMLLIIPPQIFYIRLANGTSENILDFYSTVLRFQWFPKGNFHWLHLWYLAFIFAFTLLILPILHFFKFEMPKKTLGNFSDWLSKPLVLFSSGIVFTLPYYLVQLLSLSQNIAQLALYFPFFLFGGIFLINRNILSSFKQYSNRALVLGCLSALGLYVISLSDNYSSGPFNMLHSSRQAPALFVLQTYNLWFWLIAFFGLGIRYLNKGSKALSYATTAVYPFYILHQTIIVIIAYYVVQWDIPLEFKLFLIVADSFMVILFMYEFMIRRFWVTRILFGLKASDTPFVGPSVNSEMVLSDSFPSALMNPDHNNEILRVENNSLNAS